MCTYINYVRTCVQTDQLQPSRLRDYEALVELGARVGVKIRERDQLGSSQSQKVSVRFFVPLLGQEAMLNLPT